MNLHMLVIIVDVNILRHQVNVLGHFSLYMYVLYREKRAKHDILGATVPRQVFLKKILTVQDHC